MANYQRRQVYGLLLIALGIALFAAAFFVRVRRLVIVATLLVAIGAVMLARKMP